MEIAKGHKAFTGKRVAQYLLLPGFWPRVRELFGSGFVHISFFLAQIYAAVGLLPPTHPYLNPENRGRFGIRHVVAEAASRLKWKKENIDQIIIFVLMLLGLAILLLQFVFLAGTLFLGMAQAAPALPTNFGGFFLTPDNTTGTSNIDVAFVLLDRVFGVENIFTTLNKQPTCVAANEACFQQFAGLDPYGAPITFTPEGTFPWPFHYALHTMFEIYSIGLLIIALLIFLYFVVTVAVETAQSGTPFGRRFNHVWAPIRMVVALGLLIPVANGLNAGQYITLYAAKFGSSFATNGWNTYFLDSLGSDTPLGPQANLVAEPNVPALNSLLEFALIVRTCMKGYQTLEDTARPKGGTGYYGREVEGWLVKGVERENADQSFAGAHAFYDWGDTILVRFGDYHKQTSGEEKYKTYPGYVVPVCGDLMLHISDVNQPGSKEIVEKYWLQFVRLLFLAEMPGSIGFQLDAYAEEIARCYISEKGGETWAAGSCNESKLPTTTDLVALSDKWRNEVQTIIQAGVNTQRTSGDFSVDSKLKALGWGGAGLWYNKVAEINGALIATAQGLPVGTAFPAVMREVLNQRLKQDNDITSRDVFRDYRSDKMEVQFSHPGEAAILNGMGYAYEVWTDVYEQASGSIFYDAIKALLGVDGLYNIRDNPDIHPLAQLVTIGRSLVESSIRNFGFSFFSGVGGGLISIMGPHSLGGTAMAASDFLWKIASIGLGLGFVLFYIIPFMPFIYFFFAVGGWVKSIFEAMVGVPLWALAHIRIDGNGLMGDAASSGYFLILEIFLRPILIIFGLIASIQIFAAQVYILHDIWPLVTSSVGGFDETAMGASAPGTTGSVSFKRDYVDEFFYTVIYAIIIYMLGLASFKLINLIPNNILRWLGASVPTFQEQSGDPAQGLTRNTYLGTSIMQGGIDTARGGVMNAMKSRASISQASGQGS